VLVVAEMFVFCSAMQTGAFWILRDQKLTDMQTGPFWILFVSHFLFVTLCISVNVISICR
jgi:hypothetical protein